jgi:hypothetical protein
MMLNKIVFIIICILGLSACEPQSEKDLRVAKESEDIMMQLDALKLLEAQKTTAFHNEFLMVRDVVELNRKAAILNKEKAYRKALFVAAQANAMRDNKQSRALIKEAGKTFINELVILDIIVPWYENGQVLLGKEHLAMGKWHPSFVIPLKIPKNDIYTLFTGEPEELSDLTFEDAKNISRVVSAGKDNLSKELRTAFTDVQAMLNLVILDVISHQISLATTSTFKFQRQLITQIQKHKRMKVKSDTWPADFIKNSEKYQAEIDEKFMNMAGSSRLHIYNAEPSVYQNVLKEITNNVNGVIKSMLLPEEENYTKYVAEKKARENLAKNELRKLKVASANMNRWDLSARYVEATEYLHNYYQRYHELYQPLKKYEVLIRG